MKESTLKKKKDKQTASGRRAGFIDSFSMDLAIDLGTANTLIYTREKGVVFNEPSIVAVNGSGKVIAIGRQAQLMHEKTHHQIRTVNPLKGGVIAEIDIAEKMLKEMMKSVKKSWRARIRNMIVCVPNGITDVERSAVRISAKTSGAKNVYLVDETIAAAVGVGIDIRQPVGHMIVDIGGGTTEIAIISLAGIVYAKSVRTGGMDLNTEIINYFRRNHNLLVGERTAEKVKIEIGSATPFSEEKETIAKGRDLVSGIPRTRVVTSGDVRAAIDESVKTIVEAIAKSLEQTPPELSADILEHGIVLTGGGALLHNLDKRIRQSTELPVHVADDPLTAVVRGTGTILDDLDRYRMVLM